MNLKDKWVATFEQFPHKGDILKDIRKEALSFFAEKGFPHKKVEAWKYTSLSKPPSYWLQLVATYSQ